MGMFKALAALTHSSSLVGQLNGQKWNCNFDIDVRSLIQNQIHVAGPARETIKTVGTETPDARLHQACSKLCEQFTDLFKLELGCLKDVELEVQFQLDFKPSSVNLAQYLLPCWKIFIKPMTKISRKESGCQHL